jgi:hypothetical protein
MGEEYGGACAASPLGAICGIITPGEDGRLAGSPGACARERLRDPEVRRRPGERGRATIEARFALDGAAPHMLELLEPLL